MLYNGAVPEGEVGVVGAAVRVLSESVSKLSNRLETIKSTMVIKLLKLPGALFSFKTEFES